MSEAARGRYMRFLAMVRSGDLSGAETGLANALRLTPKDPNLLQLAALVAEQTGDRPKAIQFYRRALTAHPGWMEVTFNFARLLGQSRQPKEREEAAALMQQLTQLYPQQPEVWEAMARSAQSEGRLPEAAEHWRKALNLKPENPAGRGQYLFTCRQMCDWVEQPRAGESLPPNITALFFDDPARQKESATRYCRAAFANIPTLSPPLAWRHDKIRIGYLSSDFHAHATSYLMAELFALHDRKTFEVYTYSYGIDDKSAIRERIRQESDHFKDLSALTPRACAEAIRADEIDVLVDLKGHTTGGRLDILAHRPARLQLHWLGFPATTGASFIDGFVADEVTVPQGSEAGFSERILRLPHTYQINDRQRKAALPKPRSAYGLPEDALVLASFNQTYKITPELFDIWCDLLAATPQAILWLLESNPYAPDRLRAAARSRGLDPARLFFAKPMALDEHLARYHHVDLALDTFPVGGHTTTSDALWMAVPVLTRCGNSFISRVAASLLTSADLPQLVTQDAKEYAARALGLIGNGAERSALKQHLQSKRTSLPLFDTPRFVKDWEALLSKELGKSIL